MADTRLSRGRFLAVAGSFVGTLALPVSRAAAAAPPVTAPDPVDAFVSRPNFSPPLVQVRTALPSAVPGYILLAPSTGSSQLGPLIVDETGEPVWFRPLPETGGSAVHNFRVQEYLGKPVLTWWEGTFNPNGYGEGDYYVLDSTYKQVAKISAGNGLAGDLHEFLVTPNNTALISAYNAVPTDLSPYGGPVDGQLLEGVVQEVDIASGAVLFEWHSADHVPISESFLQDVGGAWDYFHLNSIDLADDGNLLISARHTSTVYKIDHGTGEIIWRLGGMKSDFALGVGARFAYQHDARDHGNGVVSIFDDGAYSPQSAIEAASRAIVLQLDTTAMTAELTHANASPNGVISFAEGNAQLLDDGGMFVGWGTVPGMSEFAADGTLRFDAVLPGGGTSYRAFRLPWTGAPTGPPNITAKPNGDGSMQLYVSWNGATEIAHWQIHGGQTRGTLQPLQTVARTGFETSIRLKKSYPFLAAVALSGQKKTLASSRVIRS